MAFPTMLLARRAEPVRKETLLKALFNGLDLALAVGAAELAFRAVESGAHPAGFRQWLALLVACLAVDGVTYIAVASLMALRRSVGRVQRLVEAAESLALMVPVNAAFAIITASVMRVTPWGALLPVVLVVGAVLILRRQRDLEMKFSNLELLYAFSHSLTGVTEATDVLTTTLESIKELLSSQDSEILIKERDKHIRICLHPNGALVNQTVSPDALERLVLDNGTGVVVQRGKGIGSIDADLERRGWRDAVLVPLRGSEGLEGVMTAGQKLGIGNAFGPSDQRLLETFASHSIVALRGSNLLDRLRAEVAARSYEALHDSLTGLGNRTLFRQRLDIVLREARGRSMAVLMVDIDNFKEINDTLGHHTGDDVLRTAAERISDTVGTAGMACRIGGDEFAVILDSPTCEEHALQVAADIREAVGRPLLAETMNFELQSAIGVAISPDDGADGNSLLRRADIAMYTAKTEKTAIERYDPARDPNTTRRLRLSGDLRRAIAAGEIQLWYQPKAELATGRIIGVEALARWRHERYGQVPPDEFVPLAEQSGSISALTWVVLEKAFAQKKDWERQGLALDMAVNISARSLLDADLLGRLQGLLSEYEIDPGGIILELTESSVMVDAERAEEVLEQIHQLGIRIAVDDFGTGYSSLSRLSRLSVSEIKIDKSFVSNMLSSKTEAIVVATIELARNLGQVVTAEGVEDRATWDRLLDLGCECVQGYYLSRPMPAAVATSWLLDMTRRRALRQPA
ncbi:EAL domain-containing protein [Acidimicrobiaceae bacterium USS-CC1]|uniref:EAL domain-containing protein n=1 Tax=Acidiferrimicrobium australe TaxID=2664430 RepID=A0ABW9QTR9_9ACTN|nr:EAL domain-containing protein [Acidiferrimicrobium australe]